MLIKASQIKGYSVEASDGPIGTVSDLLFDDDTWTTRWLVVETGNWLFNRQVLLPASALGHPDLAARTFPVHLTRTQVKNSPDVDTHLPVSRQLEANIYDYYGFSPYWGTEEYLNGYGYWGGMAFTPPMPMIEPDAGTTSRQDEILQMQRESEDAHLRSIDVLRGYHIHATDGEIGHLADVLLDDTDWTLHYLVVDTSNWWQGKEVLISPRSTQSIMWTERMLYLGVDRAKVQASPDYNPDLPVDAALDADLARHYGPQLQAA
jgi:sporulation protein YlmC with PRC-barrel domain